MGRQLGAGVGAGRQCGGHRTSPRIEANAVIGSRGYRVDVLEPYLVIVQRHLARIVYHALSDKASTGIGNRSRCGHWTVHAIELIGRGARELDDIIIEGQGAGVRDLPRGHHRAAGVAASGRGLDRQAEGICAGGNGAARQADASSSRADDDRHGRRRSVRVRNKDKVVRLNVHRDRFAGGDEGGVGIDSRLDLRRQRVG